MSREASIWTKLTRKGNGGVHNYVPKDILEHALKYAGLDPNAKELEVSFCAMRGGRNRGSIHMRIRVIKAAKGFSDLPSVNGGTHEKQATEKEAEPKEA